MPIVVSRSGATVDCQPMSKEQRETLLGKILERYLELHPDFLRRKEVTP